jgi:hypothetical protein
MFGFVGGYPTRFCKIFDVETYNALIEKASNKIDTRKRNDQLS